MGSLWRWLTDPRIGDRLLREEDEDIVDVVHKHPVVYIVPALLGLARPHLLDRGAVLLRPARVGADPGRTGA